ncbi:MAG: hypothetical protein IT362_09875 [Deltaproteobacteria bacterium]|nr:hypothetical protein [Deltaproteobacteria bacterium]
MKKYYSVSLDIVTNKTTSAQIVSAFGIKIDDLVSIKDKQKTIWKFFSDCKKNQKLEDHIISITSKIKKHKISKSNLVYKAILLDVGIFYDTVTCTVNIKGDLLKEIIELIPDISIEVTCYPTTS